MERKFGKLFSNLIKMSLLLVVVTLITLPSSAFAGDPKIKAMTRNVYLGADIFKVVDAALNPPLIPIDPDDPACEDPESPDCPKMPDPMAIPKTVAVVFQDVLNSNFPERAEALADEIALFEPDVVGLQEVSRYEITVPSNVFGPLPPGYRTTEVVIDFYSVLEAALQARGMNYTAFINTNADIEMPMLVDSEPFFLSDVRMVDHDVILVREDHAASNEYKGNYQYQLELDVGGAEPLAFTRGYIAVDVDIKGDVYRFVNTHLEVRSSVGSVYRVFQAAQMQELLTILSYETKPIVMVGDFNSSSEDLPGESYVPDGEGGYVLMQYVPPYMLAKTYFGYKDAWLEQKKFGDGFTSGFDEYVSDPTAELTSRIDIVFVDPKNLEIDKVMADVVGDEVSDMTPSGLWPSDHAGVVAKIKFE